MPPKPKTEVQRESEKREIISAALDIIMENGLEELSMRKLGAKLHMSATNIYNYFYNKDEIYLHVLITGFEIFNRKLRDAVDECASPLEALEKLLRAYVSFGMDYPSYYELMFCTEDPKSLDYVGTSAEELAKNEKETSMVSLKLLNSLVAGCLPQKTESEVYIVSARIFCELHGFVHFCHTNVLKEINADFDLLREDIIGSIISVLKTY